MTPAPARLNAPSSGRTRASAQAAVLWHVAWAVAALLAALAVYTRDWGDRTVLFGFLFAAAPGLIGLTFLARDSSQWRSVMVAVWGMGAITAAALTGGLAGPLSAFVFLPLAAGVGMGGARKAQTGALWAAAAGIVGLISVRTNGYLPVNPTLAALSGVLTLGLGALAARLRWMTSDDRHENAEAETRRIEAIVAGQPGLMLVATPEGRAVAAYGSPLQGIDVDPLFRDGLIGAATETDRPAIEDALKAAMGGAAQSLVFTPSAALDRCLRLLLRCQDIPGEPPRLVAQLFDDTARHDREVALETARTEAEARESGKTHFFANMAHELRTPLNAVLGFADIMRQRIFGPMPDRYAEYADNIHQAGSHLLSLINDLLDVSKIEARRYSLNRERIDAREVLSEAVALMRVTAEEKGVALSSSLPGRPLMIDADPRALKQITLNLLSNAVKFTPAKGVVTLSSSIAGEDFELMVADTGAGIAAADIGRLGKPFEQAGDAEQKRLGTGLGLSLVRSLTELHGGSMAIDSQLGEGTVVTIHMPVGLPMRKPGEGGAEIIHLPKAGGTSST